VTGNNALTPEQMRDQVVSGFAEIAGQYATGTDFFERVARQLLVLSAIRHGDRVLDVGCGKGAATIIAAELAGPGGHVTGIDTSVTMLEQADLAARRRKLRNVSFFFTDAEDPHTVDPWERGHQDPQPFGAASFDVIVASNVIQFLPDPARAVRSWYRLLRPGGWLAFSWSIVQDPAWAPVMAVVDARVPPGMPGFEAWVRRPPFHDPAAVETMLKDAGYTDIDTTRGNVTTAFGSPADWWASCLTAAPWAVSWRHIPPRQLEATRQEAFGLLEGMRAGGSLTRTLRYGYTQAGKPSRGRSHSDPGVGKPSGTGSAQVGRRGGYQ